MSTLSFGPLSRIVVLSLLLLLLGGIVAAGSSGATQATGTLEGEVEDELGDPIQDATVNITGHDTLEATTDSEGYYEITDVPGGEENVRVTKDGYETDSVSVSVSTDNPPTTEDFDLVRTRGDVSGTVTASSGELEDEELQDVEISLTHENSSDQQLIDELDDISTDEDGEFGDISIPTGEITINATKDGFDAKTTSTKTITEGQNDFSVELDEDVTTIDGIVTNQNGDAIENADVEVILDDTDWSDVELDAETDSNGGYQIDNVPVSTTGESRTIEASASTFESESNTTTVSSSGETINFALSHEDANFELTVEDEFGNSLDNIAVEIDGTEFETSGGVVSANPPFGTYDVTIDHPDYESKTITTEVEQGGTEESVEITRATDVRLDIDSVAPDFWQEGDEVEFDVSFEEEVYGDVEVSVDGPDGDSQQVYSELFEDDEDDFDDSDVAEGSFTVDGFDDGQYTLSVSALGETESQSFTVSNVVDAEGASFGEPEYRSVAGDFVEVDVDIGDQDEAYILIGGDRDSDGQNFENYLDVLHVDGGETFIINTRLVGTDRDSEDVYIGDDVTSYAHSIGADSEPQGDFASVSFQSKNGNEIASTLAEFRDEMGFDDRSSPLQTSRYRLVAGGSGAIVDRDGVPNVDQPIARSNLVLTQPELGEVTTYTLPPGAADEEDIGGLLGDATEADRVSRGDRILIEVQASGMFGALLDDNEDGLDADEIPVEWVQTLLDRHEGVNIELKDSELAGANRPGAELRFSDVSSSDLYVLPDNTADQWDDGDTLGGEPVIGGFYIVIDTRGSDPFDGRPTDGDELTFEIAYESPDGERYQYQDYSLAAGEKPNPFDPSVSTVDGLEHFPYFGSRGTTVSANSSFVFEYPYIDYGETTLDDELLVPAEDGGVISGETNIAPGSQAEIQLVASNRPDPKLITIEDVEITEDRTFEVTEDFSAFEPGERVEVEFHTQGRLTEDRIIDKRGVRVVDDLDNPATFEITDHTESAEVMRGTRLDDIEATITNTGDIADRQQVRFEIDGEAVKQETVTLDSGESERLDLSDSFVMFSPGTYTYTVQTDDDEQSGELTVTEPDDETAEQLDTLDTDEPTVEDDPEDTPGDDPDGDGIVGLFGIQRRDIAVAATVTGAMHVLGQWT